MIPETAEIRQSLSDVRGVAPNTEADSFIDYLSRVGSKGLNHQDCEVLFHAGMQRITQQRESSQQQQQPDNQPQAARQSTRQEREKERGEREKERKGEGERGRTVRKGERGKEEGRDAEEEECKQVEKDATGWIVVTRNKIRGRGRWPRSSSR